MGRQMKKQSDGGTDGRTVLKIDARLSEIFSEPINIALAATKHFLWHVYDITQLSQSFF